MKYKFLILFIMIFILLKSCVVSAMQVNKNLVLSVNTSHILTFDEKIIRYKLQNENGFCVEILSSIYDNRQELLIKSFKKLDNKLTVWTESRVYTFNIQAKTDNSFVLAELSSGMTDFDLDNPPEINHIPAIPKKAKESQGLVKLRELP